MDRQKAFDTVLEYALKVSGFSPSSQELALIRQAWDGIYHKRHDRLRKSPESWAGVRNTDNCDQSLRSAFCRLFHYHAGWSSAYLGTVLNATDNLRFLADSYGLTPHRLTDHERYYWNLPEGSPERGEARRKRDENEAIAKRFADHCDTFIQVCIYLQTKGKRCSAAGEIWSKALRGD